MAIQDWELRPYEFAAVQMCQRLNENPYEIVHLVPEDRHVERWMVIARRMHEHLIMVELMRAGGFGV